MSSRPTMPERPAELRATLCGSLTHANAVDLRAALTAVASRRPRRLVLDLEGVTDIDGTALTILSALERRIRGAGGLLAVVARGRIARTIVAVGAGHLLDGAPEGEPERRPTGVPKLVERRGT